MTEQEATCYAAFIKEKYTHLVAKVQRSTHKSKKWTLVLQYPREGLRMKIGLRDDLQSVLQVWNML